MNSSSNRKKEKKVWKELMNKILDIAGVVICVLVSITICVFGVIGINKCSRNESANGYHYLYKLRFNELPKTEDPLILWDDIVFDDEFVKRNELVFYYHRRGELNKYRFVGIPLSRCKFYHKNDYNYENGQGVEIKVQEDSLGKYIYGNNIGGVEMVDFMKRNITRPYRAIINFQSPDSLSKYIGFREIKKKTR